MCMADLDTTSQLKQTAAIVTKYKREKTCVELVRRGTRFTSKLFTGDFFCIAKLKDKGKELLNNPLVRKGE